MENLNLFFSRIKELNFWQRLFSWSSIKALSYDAFDEFKRITEQVQRQHSKIEELKNLNTKLETENIGLSKSVVDQGNTLTKRDFEYEKLNDKYDNLVDSFNDIQKKLTEYDSVKESREKEYESKISQLNQAKLDLDNERIRLNDERVQEKQDQFEKMKKQWSEHETNVQQSIKALCQKHLVTYVDKVPFKGNPDNTLSICDEFIVFDAKCPANEDLNNFPKYIKAQTDNVKKYAGQDGVKKDIFLVIPTNTIDAIPQHSYNMGGYNVFIITQDSLEPIILSLKKIEEYEFADQLSPEERDNICRVVGKFAHTTKRKIQIDQFFAQEFIELLVKCKNDLPEEFLQSVIEFEKAEKLNPPTERRTKQILTKDLLSKNESINAEAQIRDIEIPRNFEEVKKLK
ncbi:hypothetical protein [Christiangramia sp.]|uniref:hypothetical protein n=1 Tax=Christiangramia sp. TaxID=1931228 RepID=UPI00262F404D|nr:hypothetical protein [Christiangramia sp.]